MDIFATIYTLSSGTWWAPTLYDKAGRVQSAYQFATNLPSYAMWMVMAYLLIVMCVLYQLRAIARNTERAANTLERLHVMRNVDNTTTTPTGAHF